MTREDRIKELRELLETLDGIGKPDCGAIAYEYDKAQEELLKLEEGWDD